MEATASHAQHADVFGLSASPLALQASIPTIFSSRSIHRRSAGRKSEGQKQQQQEEEEEQGPSIF